MNVLASRPSQGGGRLLPPPPASYVHAMNSIHYPRAPAGQPVSHGAYRHRHTPAGEDRHQGVVRQQSADLRGRRPARSRRHHPFRRGRHREERQRPSGPPRDTRRRRSGRRRAAARRIARTAPRARALSPTEAYVLTKERVQEMVRETRDVVRGARWTRRARHLAATRRRRMPRWSVAGERSRLRRRAHPRSSTTCSANARCPTTRCTACRRCARSRISRSPAIAAARVPVADRGARRGEGGGRAGERGARACSPPDLRDAIVRAAREIRAGRHHEHFLVDMIQGGAGTSTNMNANEVIANRALELLGDKRGDYDVVHPEQPRQPQPVDERRLSDGGEARAAREHRTICGAHGELAACVPATRATSSAPCSRWAARSCRMPCR